MSWTYKFTGWMNIRQWQRRRTELPFKDMFVHFHQLLEENTRALEIITEMEDKLGGEYVFDRKFIMDAVANIKEVILRSAYHFNAITHNRYAELYDVIEHLTLQLQQELSGHLVIPSGQRIVALRDINDTLNDDIC